MKNLLFVRKSNPQVGGVEMQMLRIALWLREHKLVNSSLATDDVNSPLAKLFIENRFSIYPCRLSGRFYMKDAVKQLKSLIELNNIQFVQAHMFRESVVCRFVKLFKPDLIHVFRIETYIDCSNISSKKKWLYHKLAYMTAGKVDYYLANGNLVAEELNKRSGIDIRNIQVVFNGVEKFGESDNNPITKTNEGFLPVAMVANLIRGKGHEMIFEVIAALKNENVKISVTLFGDDMDATQDYKNELINLVKKLEIGNYVHFHGFSGNLNIELKDFRIVILPSYSEGTPNTILEAMSVSKLVVASNAGELPFIIEDGVSGVIHQIGDKSKLQSILKHIYKSDSNKFDEIRKNGEKRWKENFSLDGMMEKLVRIYS